MKELFKYYLSIYFILLPVLAYGLFVGIRVKEGSILVFLYFLFFFLIQEFQQR